MQLTKLALEPTDGAGDGSVPNVVAEGFFNFRMRICSTTFMREDLFMSKSETRKQWTHIENDIYEHPLRSRKTKFTFISVLALLMRADKMHRRRQWEMQGTKNEKEKTTTTCFFFSHFDRLCSGTHSSVPAMASTRTV